MLITKPKDTYSEYVILTVLPRQQWLRERFQRYVIRTLPVLFVLTL